MIGNYLILLGVAVAIASASCLQVPQFQLVSSPVVSAQVVSSPVVSTPVYSAQVPSYSEDIYKTGLVGGNVFSAGSAVVTDGPETAPLPVLQAPSVTLPAVESPIVSLPSQPIPAPRVISQRCICTKTVVKPQIIQRQVTVPKVQRYFKRTVTPIVENVSYKSRPISSQNVAAVSASSTVGVAPVNAMAYSAGNCYSRIC